MKAKRILFISACIILPGGVLIALAYALDRWIPRKIRSVQ